MTIQTYFWQVGLNQTNKLNSSGIHMKWMKFERFSRNFFSRKRFPRKRQSSLYCVIFTTSNSKRVILYAIWKKRHFGRYIHTHIHTHTHTHAHTHTHTYRDGKLARLKLIHQTWLYAHAHTHKHIHTYTYTHTHTHSLTHSLTHTNTHKHAHAHT